MVLFVSGDESWYSAYNKGKLDGYSKGHFDMGYQKGKQASASWVSTHYDNGKGKGKGKKGGKGGGGGTSQRW